MISKYNTIKIILIIYSTILFITKCAKSEPDRLCLDCICHASSGCKRNIQCHNDGNGQYYCGPYQISWPYWADGGRPGDTGLPHDFEKCLVNKTCAEDAVRGYMKRYGSDCNKDGSVDCYDYAAMHKTGPFGSCTPAWLNNSKYWQEFTKCYAPPPSASPSAPSSSPQSSLSRTLRGNLNYPPTTMIEIVPRNNPSSFLPPLPQPLPRPPPLILPPLHTHASASVPGASASASAGAGFDPITGNPLTFTSTSVGNPNDNTGIIRTYPPLPPAPGRLEPSKPPSQIQPVPGILINKPQPSTPVLVPSENINRIKPTRFELPDNQNPPPSSVERENPIIKPVPSIPSVLNIPSVQNVPTVKPSVLSEQPAELNVADPNQLISQDCLDCLCHASSKCDLRKGCEGAYCGPYLLSWGYWADGGRPGFDHAACSKKKSCSEMAIQGYMNKWKRDCNNDGKIDCIDFALIHKLGPHGCQKLQALQSTDYWNQFTQCYKDDGANIPVAASRLAALVEIPRPQPRSHEIFIDPLSGEHVPEDRDVLIRVNDPRQNNVSPPERPATRIDLGTLNSSKPIIVRIKPPANYDHPNLIDSNPRVQSQPIERFEHPNRNIEQPVGNIEQPVRNTEYPIRNSEQPIRNIEHPVRNIGQPINNIEQPARNIEQPARNIEQPKPTIRDNDDFFSQPRPFEQPSSNEQPNVSEIPRPKPPRARPPVRQNATSSDSIPIECLECICYASSKCNPSIGCRSEGSGKYICGSYQVDLEYWIEAGKPGNRADLSNIENFQMCTNNRECADRTVSEYLKRFRKDCNEDGTIDCNDYAAVHIGGPNHCGAQWYVDSRYYSDFRECYDF